MFRLLGLNPGTDITADAAGALADLPTDRAEALLEDLLDAHVLLQQVPGRYTMHDLLREHARSVAVEDESAEERHCALHRLADFYLHKTSAAIEIMYPDTKHRMRPIPETTLSIAGYADALAATAWVDVERANLLAGTCQRTATTSTSRMEPEPGERRLRRQPRASAGRLPDCSSLP